MQRLQKPLAATITGKFYSSHVAFKLLLNFHFSNWWVWPSLKVSATLNWEQERDKWIITILKTREIPCSFLPLWTHLSLFSASTTARLPTVVCYCCWISAHRWWLWKLNFSLNVEPGLWVLALYLPSLSERCCFLSWFKSFKAPEELKQSRTPCYSRSEKVRLQDLYLHDFLFVLEPIGCM